MQILHGAQAAPHGEGDVDGVRHAPHHVHHDVAPLGGGSDVQEHELIGALPAIDGGVLDRVTRVAQALKVDPLDDAPIHHVKAGYHPLG